MIPTPDWHTDEFPELRSGPPWVMQEMIAAEPALVERLLGTPPDGVHVAAGAIAEALAHGLPVISTPTGGIAGLIGTDAGLLVPPDDADALRVALTRVLCEPQLRVRLARGAAAARLKLPRWQHTCERLSQILEQLGAQPA